MYAYVYHSALLVPFSALLSALFIILIIFSLPEATNIILVSGDCKLF